VVLVSEMESTLALSASFSSRSPPSRRRYDCCRCVAVQVAFESKTLKPGHHFIGSRVETRRLSAMGQGESTAVQPPPLRELVPQGAHLAFQLRHRGGQHLLAVAPQVDM
jgi:hypothetical protein